MTKVTVQCCTCLAPTLFVLVLLGIFALHVVTLVWSIQSLHSNVSMCTSASYKWLWWVCVSAVLHILDMYAHRSSLVPDAAVKTSDVMLVGLIYFVVSLSMGLGTQLEYLDGCTGQARETLLIYMWGNYSMCAIIVLVGLAALCVAAYSSRASGESNENNVDNNTFV